MPQKPKIQNLQKVKALYESGLSIADVAGRKPSVCAFTKYLNTSTKLVIKLFGSSSNFISRNKYRICQVEAERIKTKYFMFVEINKSTPTRREMQHFYSRTSAIINNFFEGKYTNLKLFVEGGYSPRLKDTKCAELF